MANSFTICGPCKHGNHSECTPLIGEYGNEFCICEHEREES